MPHLLPDSSLKCLPPQQLVSLAPLLARPLVFTNGVFDLLHVGHVRCLEQARQQGAALVVALNTDASTRGLRKPGWAGERPLNTLLDRASVVAGLACVSWVTWFDESTPAVLLAALKPDVYVKGGDYRAEDLPETAQVQSWGGRVAIVPFVPGHSSTRLLQQLEGATA